MAALGAAVAVAACGEAPAARPDVVLITVDTLRADRLGFLGHADARTPRLDALAARGVVFRQAIAPSPRTTPALASLHTGLWPHQHGSREVGDPVRVGTPLAVTLRDAGYRTAAVSANGTAGRAQGLDAGFDRFVDRQKLIDRAEGVLYRDLTEVPSDAPGWAEAVSEAAAREVREAPPGQPLFLWVLYFDPHFLYRPPSPWQDGVDAEACWELYAWGQEDLGRAGRIFHDLGGVATRARDACAALYDAEVAYVDAQVGRLLDAIDAVRGDRARVTVFTADHGENLGEGGLFFEHGDNVHDAAIRVPLVFAGRGVDAERSITAGHVDDEVASLVDIVPTLQRLLGLDAGGARGAGVDLSPRLAGGSDGTPADGAGRRGGSDAGSATARIAFAESAAPMYHEAVGALETGHVWGTICLHGPVYSLCQRPGDPDSAATLHDRRRDPLLRDDLSADRPAARATLDRARARWPVGSPRHLTARAAGFKLVRSPRFAGGYEDRLVDLRRDPEETGDASAAFPDVAVSLRDALDAWMEGWTPPRPSPADPAIGRDLRALGYIR